MPDYSLFISDRWLTWEPWAAMRGGIVPVAAVRAFHADRCNQLLANGISRKAIKNHDLDDPRTPNETFLSNLRAARQRHRDRIRENTSPTGEPNVADRP